MVLISSCCCFKTIRNGSFASAIYTMVFYIIVMTAGTFHIHTVYNDREMLSFTIVMVILSSLMVITSILLLIGLCGDHGQLFIPWLITLNITTLMDVIMSIYLIIYSEMDPFKAALFAFDFIITGINAQNNFGDLKKYNFDIRHFDKSKSHNLYVKGNDHHPMRSIIGIELSTISEDNENCSRQLSSNCFVEVNGDGNCFGNKNDSQRKLSAECSTECSECRTESSQIMISNVTENHNQKNNDRINCGSTLIAASTMSKETVESVV